MGTENMDNFFVKTFDKVKRLVRVSRFQGMASRFDLSDVAQETAMQAWRHIENRRMRESELDTNWLKTVATGHACKLMRFHLAAKRNVNQEVVWNDQLNDTIADSDSNRLADLLAGLDQLESFDRHVVVGRFLHQTSVADLANELTVSEYQIRKSVSNSLAYLQLHIDCQSR